MPVCFLKKRAKEDCSLKPRMSLTCWMVQSGRESSSILAQIYEGFGWADVIVFASPQYWGTISGQLKVVIDRLYAPLFRYGSEMRKEFVVIMTSRGNMYAMTEEFFAIFSRYLGWKNIGNILGTGKELQAQMLGKSI